MSKDIQSVLNQVIHRIIAQFDPPKIILCGSYAGGAPDPDSDIDLLIVMEAEGSMRQKAKGNE